MRRHINATRKLLKYVDREKSGVQHIIAKTTLKANERASGSLGNSIALKFGARRPYEIRNEVHNQKLYQNELAELKPKIFSPHLNNLFEAQKN